MIFQNDGTARRIVVRRLELWVPQLQFTGQGQTLVNENFLRPTQWKYLKEVLHLNSSRSFYLKKLKNIGRYLATYVALIGVEPWDPFRGVPNWTLICINVGVKWGVCIGVVVVTSKINI